MPRKPSHFIFQETDSKVLVFQDSASSDGSDDLALRLKDLSLAEESDSSVDQASGDSSQRLSQLSQSLGGDQGEVSDGKVSALRQSIRILHEQGHCKPCRYFRFREDGCRHGDAWQ
eukprot:g6685.t1